MNSILQSRLQKYTSGCILLLLVNILYKVILNSIWRSSTDFDGQILNIWTLIQLHTNIYM